MLEHTFDLHLHTTPPSQLLQAALSVTFEQTHWATGGVVGLVVGSSVGTAVGLLVGATVVGEDVGGKLFGKQEQPTGLPVGCVFSKRVREFANMIVLS